jgi:hypothetical protein
VNDTIEVDCNRHMEANMAGKRPDYKVLISRESGDKTFYSEIGSGWNVAKDGISIQLHSLPIDGKCVIFPRKEE